MFVVAGAYIVKTAMRDAFVKAIYDQDIISGFRKEKGNISYDYYYPYEDLNSVFFVERWENPDAWEAHKTSPNTIKLQAVKAEFTTGFAPGFLGELKENTN